MQEWSKQHPEQAAERQAARAHARDLRRLLKTVSGLFADGDLERAAEVVREGLDATMPVVVPGAQEVVEGKVVSTGGMIEFVPDHRARLESAKFLTAMVEGLPVARQMTLHADWKELDAEQMALLMNNEAAQEALADLSRAAELLKDADAPLPD